MCRTDRELRFFRPSLSRHSARNKRKLPSLFSKLDCNRVKKKVDGYIRIYHLETENAEWLLFWETREKGWRLTAARRGGPTTPEYMHGYAHTHASSRIGIHESSAVLAKIENNEIIPSHASRCHFRCFSAPLHTCFFFL